MPRRDDSVSEPQPGRTGTQGEVLGCWGRQGQHLPGPVGIELLQEAPGQRRLSRQDPRADEVAGRAPKVCQPHRTGRNDRHPGRWTARAPQSHRLETARNPRASGEPRHLGARHTGSKASDWAQVPAAQVGLGKERVSSTNQARQSRLVSS